MQQRHIDFSSANLTELFSRPAGTLFMPWRIENEQIRFKKKCVRCHGKIVYKISETIIHGYPERQLAVNNVPGHECQKCGL